VNRFQIVDTPLPGLKVVKRDRLSDARGFLSRLYCADELREAGWNQPIAQINHTLTHRSGAVRGMHFQHPPYAEIKLVSCIRGEVWDVAVDLRRGSPTFLRWYAERLSPENGRALLIPMGFAHGFQALVPDCELIYLHSCAYQPASEGAIHSEDPSIGIAWPHTISELSARDRGHPLLPPNFHGISV
jgi:dTDP-4-dehydrorhamnose 3,5-epimerase